MGTWESIYFSLHALCVLNSKCLCKWELASNSPSGLASMDAIYSHEKEVVYQRIVFISYQMLAWVVIFEAVTLAWARR